jgi:hypothetical protein
MVTGEPKGVTMIKIVVNDEGQHAPQAFCDHCGKRIERAEDGNYEWQGGQMTSGNASDLYLVHKACSYAFEETTGKPHRTAELTLLPIRLGNNLEIDWDEANERAKRMSELS